jgi:hypothetical protein
MSAHLYLGYPARDIKNLPSRWTTSTENMSQPRVSLWATEEEIDEDLQVDVNLAIGNYGQNGLYDDGTAMVFMSIGLFTLRWIAQPRIDEATLAAVQHQMAQQAAFSQIPDAVKRVRIARECISITYLFTVYRSLPPSGSGEQPRRDHRSI